MRIFCPKGERTCVLQLFLTFSATILLFMGLSWLTLLWQCIYVRHHGLQKIFYMSEDPGNCSNLRLGIFWYFYVTMGL